MQPFQGVQRFGSRRAVRRQRSSRFSIGQIAVHAAQLHLQVFKGLPLRLMVGVIPQTATPLPLILPDSIFCDVHAGDSSPSMRKGLTICQFLRRTSEPGVQREQPGRIPS